MNCGLPYISIGFSYKLHGTFENPPPTAPAGRRPRPVQFAYRGAEYACIYVGCMNGILFCI
eukprot:COSAG02_NODE_2193_length_9555_cov_102.183481_5_plen_61_part_00